jgi:hypothetical protein
MRSPGGAEGGELELVPADVARIVGMRARTLELVANFSVSGGGAPRNAGGGLGGPGNSGGEGGVACMARTLEPVASLSVGGGSGGGLASRRHRHHD